MNYSWSRMYDGQFIGAVDLIHSRRCVVVLAGGYYDNVISVADKGCLATSVVLRAVPSKAVVVCSSHTIVCEGFVEEVTAS
ncbi:unnamed protein product [Colias eurytheme]|nr:unnamed protein product [Colias eurytheme]